MLRPTALAYLREGDVFIITRLSRAMRSLRHMIELAEQLRERGIGLVVLKQAIDTTTPHRRLVFHILAAIDEVIRELIVEGTDVADARHASSALLRGSPPHGRRRLCVAGKVEQRAGVNQHRTCRSIGVARSPFQPHGPPKSWRTR